MQKRKVLDGNINKDARKQINDLIKSGISKAQICKGSGVNFATLRRFIAGENTSGDTLDKLGTWIVKNKH